MDPSLSLSGARPRRRGESPLPGLVFELELRSTSHLADALIGQDGFGLAVFKQSPTLLEAIVTDYRDGSNADLLFVDGELLVLPGYTASRRFFGDLVAALDAALGVVTARDWAATPPTLAELTGDAA